MNLLELQPTSGIYKIVNTQNGKVYIGQSKYILSRIADHIYHLITGKHSNVEFAEDFQKYGLGAFDFEIINECDISNLLELEHKTIWDYHKNGYELYNHLTIYDWME